MSVLRFFIQNKKTEKIKALFWFTVNEEGFYYGPSQKSSGISETLKNTNNLLHLKMPDVTNKEFDTHFSWHKSGDTHIKKLRKGDKNLYVPIFDKKSSLASIDKPVRISVNLTGKLFLYPDYNKKLVKNGDRAFIIRFDEKDFVKRLYIEFYVSPEGVFDFPETLIKLSENTEMGIVCENIDEKIILVVRYALIDNIPTINDDQGFGLFEHS
jgi:hypothetical protein